MLRKELLELFKTGRLVIVTGVMIFFGILGPAAARYLPQLMEGQLPEGMQIIMPAPVPADGIQQFLENVGQLGWVTLILVTMGALAGERATGTVAVVLATPVSRNAFVLAKLISRLLLLLVSVLAGAAVCLLYTGLLLGAYPLPEFLAATGLFVLYGALVIAWTILMSSLVNSPASAPADSPSSRSFSSPPSVSSAAASATSSPSASSLTATSSVCARRSTGSGSPSRSPSPSSSPAPSPPTPASAPFPSSPPPDLLTLYPRS
jgi:hypothetical protein